MSWSFSFEWPFNHQPTHRPCIYRSNQPSLTGKARSSHSLSVMAIAAYTNRFSDRHPGEGLAQFVSLQFLALCQTDKVFLVERSHSFANFKPVATTCLICVAFDRFKGIPVFVKGESRMNPISRGVTNQENAARL